MNNLNIELTKQKIEQIIAQSNLTIGTVHYLLKDIQKDIKKLYKKQLDVEFKESENNKKETQQED